jgi:hypothetical protein
MEIWKTIKGFENYQVSNFGRVKSLEKKTKFGCSFKTYPEIILKNWIDKKGYHYVDLRNNNLRKRFLVHRLVGICFLENKQNKPQINHIDGVKSNNYLYNLEWNTAKENLKHAVDIGLNKKSGIYFWNSKLTSEQVKEIRNSNLSNSELSIIYNLNHSVISNVKLFKTYKNE